MRSNSKQQGDSCLPSPISSKTLDKKDQSRRDTWNIEVGIAELIELNKFRLAQSMFICKIGIE